MNNRFVVVLDRSRVRVIKDKIKVGEFNFKLSSLSPALKFLCDELANCLRENGIRGKESIALAMGSTFAFWLPTQFDARTRRNHQAICYELEEHLPVDAEQMSAICTSSRDGFQSTIVVDCSLASEFLQQLSNEHAIDCDKVAILTPLLVDHLFSIGKIDPEARLLIQDGTMIEVVESDNSFVVEWSRFDALKIQECDDHKERSTYIVHQVDMDQNFSRSAISESLKEIDSTWEELCWETLNNKTLEPDSKYILSSFFESDKLSSTGLSNARDLLVVSLLAFLLTLAGVLAYRASEFRTLTTSIDDSLCNQFRERFPERRLNAPIERLLESALAIQKEQNQLVVYSNRTALILRNLRRVLTELPGNYSFSQIKVLPAAMHLSGSVNSFVELDRLKDRLSQAGFTFQPGPYAKQFEITIEFKQESPRNEAAQ